MKTRSICVPCRAITTITPRHLASQAPTLEIEVEVSDDQLVEALANLLEGIDSKKAMELIKRADSDLFEFIGQEAVSVAAEHSFERTCGVTA
jgi:hypothetical protein